MRRLPRYCHATTHLIVGVRAEQKSSRSRSGRTWDPVHIRVRRCAGVRRWGSSSDANGSSAHDGTSRRHRHGRDPRDIARPAVTNVNRFHCKNHLTSCSSNFARSLQDGIRRRYRAGGCRRNFREAALESRESAKGRAELLYGFRWISKMAFNLIRSN
jgi:hypothetical protein